jgi:membrane protein
VAFWSVLSLFPGLLIATGLLGVLDVLVGKDVAGRVQDTVTGALDLVLTSQASGTVSSVQNLFEQHHGGLLTFATLGALVTLSGAFAVVLEALNLAYDTPELRSWLRRRLMGLGLGVATVLVVVVVLAMVVVGPFLGRGRDLASLVGLGPAFGAAWDLLRLPLLFVLLTGWLMALFRYAPSRRTRWRDSVIGAVTTSVLWLAATAGFHYYLQVVGERNPVLGAFGGGVIVMTWVYLLSLVLLAGGELNATLTDRRHLRDVPPAVAGAESD